MPPPNTEVGLTLQVPRLVGKPTYEIPFPGDPNPYIYTVPYRVRQGYHEPLPLDELGPFGDQYYHVGEAGFVAEPGGITSYVRRFAQVPASRSEYESYVYDFQIWYTDGEPIVSVPRTVQSRIQYDYIHAAEPQADIALDRAPRVFQISGTIGFVGITMAEWLALQTGDEILAEDATYRRWHGNIYERQRRYILFIQWIDLISP